MSQTGASADAKALAPTKSGRSRSLPPWLADALTPVSLAVLGGVHGMRLEYLLVAALFAVLAVVGPRSRRFARLAIPFAITGVLYDHFHYLLPWRGPIHVGDLWSAEAALFGVGTGAARVVPATWLASHTSPVLDVASGLAYMTYMFESFAIAAWLFSRDSALTARFAWAFLALNLAGMAIWLLWPAAPPWYVETWGPGPARLDVAASAAGAARFDALVGVPWFAEFYARSRNVFGAMPSLHVAYPVLACWAVSRAAGRVAVALAGAFAALVAFAAVYLQHHYVLDVVAGAALATVIWAALGVWLGRTGRQTC